MTAPLPQIADSPWMPSKTAGALADLLSGSDTYLEYGVGGSTRLAVNSGLNTVIAVESDRHYLDAATAMVEASNRPVHWIPVYVDIGPTGYLGFPKTLKSRLKWAHYAAAPWSLSLSPDLILVDGRFRLACALMAARHAKPGTLVFFDDYATRPWYWSARHYLSLVARAGRAAIFEVQQSPSERLDQAILKAARDPR